MAKHNGASINWSGMDTALAGVAQELRERTALLADIGEVLLSSTLQRFAEGKAPDGKIWEVSGRAWKEGLAHEGGKEGGFGQTLMDTARLRNSINIATGFNDVYVGSNLVYARIHQMGGKAGRNHKVTIPARPYLGITEEDKEEIADTIARHLQSAIKIRKGKGNAGA